MRLPLPIVGISRDMASSGRDVLLIPVSSPAVAFIVGRDSDSEGMEEVRLLDAYDDGNVGDLSTIEEGGGSGGMKRIQVRVTGMTCAACSNSVEGALKSVNGVMKASVALLQNRADVVFDPDLVK